MSLLRKAAEFKKVCQPHKLFLVGIANHRCLVEQHDGAAHVGPRPGETVRVGPFKEIAVLGEEPRDRHRGNTRIALEHLDQRVLHREPQHLLAFLAEQLGDRLHHAAFARPGYALDRYDPVTR